MLSIWKIHKAKSCVIRVLQPFVDRSMIKLIPTARVNWQNPHVLGFIATLTTCIAERASGALSPSALASVQSGVLATLTKTGHVIIGDTIFLLSSLKDPTFEAGCKNGQFFFEIICQKIMHQNMYFSSYDAFYFWFHSMANMLFEEQSFGYTNHQLDPVLLDLWVDNVDNKFHNE